MYSDFERQLNIETYPAIIKCLTPIILNEMLCNDVIAVGVDPNDTTQLDSDALTMIRNAQDQLCSVKGDKDFDGSWTPVGEQLKQSSSDKIKNKIVFF